MTTSAATRIRDSLETGNVITVLSTSDVLDDAKFELLKAMADDDSFFPIYVSINKPHTAIAETLRSTYNGNPDNVFFIDCATSEQSDAERVRAENCVFVDPNALTNLSIAISEAVTNRPEHTRAFVLIDSLTGLTIYNDSAMLTKFAHFLSGKIRQWDAQTVLLTGEGTLDEDTGMRIAEFCDDVIEL